MIGMTTIFRLKRRRRRSNILFMATLEMRRFFTHWNKKEKGFRTPLRLPDVKFAKREGDSSIKERWMHLPEIVTSLGVISLFATAFLHYFN